MTQPGRRQSFGKAIWGCELGGSKVIFWGHFSGPGAKVFVPLHGPVSFITKFLAGAVWPAFGPQSLRPKHPPRNSGSKKFFGQAVGTKLWR